MSQSVRQPQPSLAPASLSADTVVRVIVAVVLLAAAAMKLEQLASEPANNCGRLACRWLGILQVQAEILLGLWLLAGLGRSYAHAMAALCFGAFAAVTLYKGLRGDASCGCFGKLDVNPWHTLLLDLAVVAALLIFRPRPAARPRSLAWSAGWFAAAVVICALAAWPMIAYRPARLLENGQIDGQGAVLLMPADWGGRPLPLLLGEHLASEQDLSRGQWTLILYKRNCRACREELADRDNSARGLKTRGIDPRIVVAELPPVAPPWPISLLIGGQADPVTADSPLARASFTGHGKWFVPTPLVVSLRDGKVTSVTMPRAE